MKLKKLLAIFLYLSFAYAIFICTVWGAIFWGIELDLDYVLYTGIGVGLFSITTFLLFYNLFLVTLATTGSLIQIYLYEVSARFQTSFFQLKATGMFEKRTYIQGIKHFNLRVFLKKIIFFLFTFFTVNLKLFIWILTHPVCISILVLICIYIDIFIPVYYTQYIILFIFAVWATKLRRYPRVNIFFGVLTIVLLVYLPFTRASKNIALTDKTSMWVFLSLVLTVLQEWAGVSKNEHKKV